MALDPLSDLTALCEDAGAALQAALVVALVPEAGRFVARLSLDRFGDDAVAGPALDELGDLRPDAWHLEMARDLTAAQGLVQGRVHVARLADGPPFGGIPPAAFERFIARYPEATIALVAVGRAAAPMLAVLLTREMDDRDRRFLRALASQAARVRESARALELERAVASRYRLIVEHCPAGVSLTDLDGTFRAVNPAMASIFGADSPDSLIGRRASELYVDPADWQRFAGNVIALGSIQDSLQKAKRLDGTPFDLLLSAVLVRDATGAPVGLVSFARDVSAERRLEGERRLLAEVLHASPMPVVILDGETRHVTYVNPAYARLVGVESPRELTGLPGEELARRFTPELDVAAVSRLMDDGDHQFETEVHRVDGRIVPVEVKASLVRAEGHGNFRVSHVHDLSHQKQLQNRLVVSEKLTAVGLLVAGVAHELNNPLTTILGCAQLLLERHEGSATLLRSVERNALRCRAVVDGLLKFARDYRPERVGLDLHALVEEALELRQSDFDRARVALVRRYDPALPMVCVDRHQMRQVFVNVVANALQAMENRPSPRLEVRTERRFASDGSQNGVPTVRVVFEDNGHGVPRQQLARVFDPFFTTKDVGAGTGLGLSLALGVVQQHGGQIVFQSTEGQGTAVIIELPIVPSSTVHLGARAPLTELLHEP